MPVSASSVSVVIPTHNRRDSLRSVLQALDKQRPPADQLEVVVVCDGCSDGTEAMCRGLSVGYRLKIVEQVQQGPAAARNRALQEASGEIVLFLDDDVVPDSELVNEHLATHTEDPRAVVIGTLLAPPGFDLEPWTRWEATMLEGQYSAMAAGRWKPTPRQFYTGNASVRRRYVLEAGAFDATFRRAEDVELAYRLERLKLNFYFRPEAKGWHFARRSLKSWLGVGRAYGEADVAMYRAGLLMTLQSMAREFQWRRRPLRRMAKAFVGRPWLLRPWVGAALVGARVAELVGWRRGAEAAYSSVFNLYYWDAISQRLGGRSAFWSLIREHGSDA
ncbi:MAG: glycosyltransferase family 2 protein [Candidatus Dormibacteraceae bacterium]